MLVRLGLVIILAALAGFPSRSADGERKLKVVTSAAVPPITAIVIYDAGMTSKDQPKPILTSTKLAEPIPLPAEPKLILTITKFAEPIPLPGAGPYHIGLQTKGGIEICVAEKLTVEVGKTHELNLPKLVGVVEVHGDNLPRADRIVLTASDDPGPGEKGHRPVQAAGDYRTEMLVPEGTYAVWVKPANGARAVKVEENIRVLAGKKSEVRSLQ